MMDRRGGGGGVCFLSRLSVLLSRTAAVSFVIVIGIAISFFYRVGWYGLRIFQPVRFGNTQFGITINLYYGQTYVKIFFIFFAVCFFGLVSGTPLGKKFFDFVCRNTFFD
jgi:hypothetical protein